ncbi:MAG TPA: hypothetical protein VLT36_15215 [Candidatus Dormibacteraeota bacterium]|nr:hypothetical protein [Candidatus Dormibacteraeota bacterium]
MPKPKGKNEPERKVVRSADTWWQLDGESELHATTIPEKPNAGPVTVRLTHSNVYGPFDKAEFFVRVGDPEDPTGEDDLNAAKDWVKTKLVEELVNVDGEEMLRSEAEEPFEDETPWEGTYEAQLTLPKGRTSIEIKVVSGEPELLSSIVLSDWELKAK